MNILKRVGGFFASNLGGVFGQKWFMAIVATIFVSLIGTIYVFQKQKSSLREEIIELSILNSVNKVEYQEELARINTKHNQIIKDMISEEEVIRLKKEIERQKKTSIIEKVEKEKLNKKLEQLNKLEIKTCELPEEVKKILNKGKVKK